VLRSEYHEHPPAAALGRALACLWTQEVSAGPGAQAGPANEAASAEQATPAEQAASAEPYVQRIVPDGCMDVVWLDGGLSVAGPDTRPAFARLDAGLVVGVRFRPGAAPAALGVPASELVDERADLALLWGRAATDRLAGRLAGAATPAEAMLLLQQAVAERLVRAPGPPDPLAAALAAELGPRWRPGAGPLNVAEFAEQAGVSERQLRRRSIAAFGYAPKMLDRVLRLQRFLALARAAPRPSLGLLAAEAGYADQPHLSRECRELAGASPRELLT
jgi:AraC-like DNA-binding protein